ncbi:4'-phosphopantetheinyl transferase superfamily protein [Streptomyces sp. NPDC051000]|uniref:4'-phosphopantetheinyl transferase family protein n=1 Tax=Streptomyces sp. NPDC051000 TaxID=3155520 RepID=UPI003405DCE3
MPDTPTGPRAGASSGRAAGVGTATPAARLRPGGRARPADDPIAALWTPAPGITLVVARAERVMTDAAALGRLRPEEHRAAADMAPWRGREHLAGRALLRLLLAEVRGEEDARGPVVPEPAGRPRLPGSPRTGVSVSHSGPYTAAAVGDALDVGVDVQVPRPPSTGMLRRCCPPDTAARLASMPPHRAARAFARVWTVQEACVKARGTGLPGAPWRVRADPDGPDGTWDALRWLRLPWPAGAGTGTAALACAFGPPRPGPESATDAPGHRPDAPRNLDGRPARAPTRRHGAPRPRSGRAVSPLYVEDPYAY